MLAGSIEAYKTGAGTEQTRIGVLGEELKVGFKQLAPLARIKADAINGLADLDIPKLVDGLETYTNVGKLQLEFEKDPKNKGKAFDAKALDEMLSRVAKDPRTISDMEIFRQTQKEALAKQDALLAGQLSAGQKMLEAAGMFGKAGKTMLTAAKQMFNAAFKGTRGEAENIGISIDKKQEQIDSANERKAAVEAKIKKGDNTAANREELELWNDRIKTLGKEKALLAKQKELTEDKAALEDKIATSTENFKEKFEAQQIKQNQLFLAKQTALGEENKEIEN
jgi:hypothetical protein